MKSFVFCLCFLFMLPFVVNAIGVEVSPSEIELNDKNKLISFLKIKNTSDTIVKTDVWLDDFSYKVKIIPQQIILRPQEVTEIKFSIVKENNFKPKIYNTNVSLITRSLQTQNLLISSGVKIPIKIVFRNRCILFFIVIAFVLFLFVLKISWKYIKVFLLINKY